MEIECDLQRPVVCAGCGNFIDVHACCFHHDGRYYHEKCGEQKRSEMLESCVLSDCKTTNQALLFHKRMGVQYQFVNARQQYAVHVDIVTNLGIRYLIIEIATIGDRIMYAVPEYVSGELDPQYRADLEEVYNERRKAMNAMRMNYEEAKNTWVHDAVVVTPAASAASASNELMSIAHLEEDARQSLFNINPKEGHDEFKRDIQSAVRAMDNLEMSEATPLAEAHQDAVSSTTHKGKLKRVSSMVVNKVLKPLKSALPGFNTIFNWLKNFSLDKLSVAAVKEHLMKMIQGKVGAKHADAVGYLFEKLWHIIEPGIGYVLLAGKKAASYVFSHKGKGGEGGEKSTFSIANLANIASSLFSAIQWIVPIIRTLITYASAAAV